MFCCNCMRFWISSQQSIMVLFIYFIFFFYLHLCHDSLDQMSVWIYYFWRTILYVTNCTLIFSSLNTFLTIDIIYNKLYLDFQLFYMNGIQKGNFPYIKHFDTMLYTVCTGLMFHAVGLLLIEKVFVPH